MSTPSLVTLAAVPVVVAGLALGAAAQGPWQTEDRLESARERATVEATFAQADASNDGKVTREEARQWPAAAARFDALDSDGDGRLDLAEFAGSFVAPD